MLVQQTIVREESAFGADVNKGQMSRYGAMRVPGRSHKVHGVRHGPCPPPGSAQDVAQVLLRIGDNLVDGNVTAQLLAERGHAGVRDPARLMALM